MEAEEQAPQEMAVLAELPFPEQLESLDPEVEEQAEPVGSMFLLGRTREEPEHRLAVAVADATTFPAPTLQEGSEETGR